MSLVMGWWVIALAPILAHGQVVNGSRNVLGTLDGGYTHGAPGSVRVNISDKLRESVSVRDFGAKGDGVTDDWAAIQAAINYGCSMNGTYQGLTIRFPQAPGGSYRHSKPIVVPCDFLRLVGDGPLSRLQPFAAGVGLFVRGLYYPTFVPQGSNTPDPTLTGPPLLPMADGSPSYSFRTARQANWYDASHSYSVGDMALYGNNWGVSYISLVNSNQGNQPDTHPTQWQMVGRPRSVLDFADLSTNAVLSGAGSFSVRLTFKGVDDHFWNGLTGRDGGGGTDGVLHAINASYDIKSETWFPFRLYLHYTGSSVQACALGTLGNYDYNNLPTFPYTFQICGGSVTQGVAHDFEVSYNGSMVRLFLDGTMVASQAQTGTLFVPVYASQSTPDVPTGSGFPDPSYAHSVVNGFIDNVQVETAALHTANFAPPTTKATLGSGRTYALLDFSQFYDSFTVAKSDVGPSWLWLRHDGDSSTTPGQVQLRGLNLLNESGPVIASSAQAVIDDVNVLQPYGYGLYLYGNSYEARITNSQFAARVFSFAQRGTSWISYGDRLIANGGFYPMVLSTGFTCVHCIIQTQPPTIVGLVLQNFGEDRYTFVNSEVEGEGGTPPWYGGNFRSAVDVTMISAAPGTTGDAVQFVGGTIESSNHFVTIGQNPLILDGTCLHQLGQDSTIVHTNASTLPGSVRLSDLTCDAGSLTWIDDASKLSWSARNGTITAPAATITSIASASISAASLTASQLSAPGAPTITVYNSITGIDPNDSTYSYACVAYDGSGGTVTGPSASIAGPHYETWQAHAIVTCPSVPGASGEYVYRTANTTTDTQYTHTIGLIGTISNGGKIEDYDPTNGGRERPGDGTAPPAANTTGSMAAAKIKGTALVGGLNPVAFSATPTFDLSLGNTQKIVLSGSVTSSTLASLTAGQEVTFLIGQSAAGLSFTWPANVKGGGTIDHTSGHTCVQSFRSDGTNLFAASTMQCN